MIKISACVIVLNEADNIRTWLKNIKDVVDEMIVVDTGSTDDTAAIAEQGGAKVFHFAWRNDFSAAKNYALTKAEGNWIAFLDADEYFSRQAQNELRGVLEQINGNRRIIAVDSPLHNIDIDNDDRIISTTTQTRIFRKMNHLRYVGRVHESLEFPKAKKPWQIVSSNLDIFHTGYSTSLTEKKNRRNLELLLADIKANGEKPEHYTYLSTTYLNLQEYEKARHYAELAIANKAGGLMIAYVKQYRIIIKSLRGLGKSDDQLQAAIDRALADVKDYPDFLWEDAMLAMGVKDFARAESDVTKILRQVADPDFYKKFETTIFADLPQIKTVLALIRNLEGRIDEGAELLTERLQKESRVAPMVKAYFEMSRYADQTKILATLKKIYDPQKDRAFLLPYLEKRPRDEVFLYFAAPPVGSYEELMATKQYKAAAEKAAQALANNFYQGLGLYRTGKDVQFWEMVLPKPWKSPNVAAQPNKMPPAALMSLTVKFMRELSLALLSLTLDEILTMQEELALLPVGMRSSILRYFGNDEKLIGEDFDSYRTLLKEVINYGSRDMIIRFAAAATDFDEKDRMAAAGDLFDREQMTALLPIYASMPADSPLVDGEFWYRLGRCLFYVGDFAPAGECFDKAAEGGAKAEDLNGFIKWSKAKAAQTGNIKERK